MLLKNVWERPLSLRLCNRSEKLSLGRSLSLEKSMWSLTIRLSLEQSNANLSGSFLWWWYKILLSKHWTNIGLEFVGILHLIPYCYVFLPLEPSAEKKIRKKSFTTDHPFSGLHHIESHPLSLVQVWKSLVYH